MGLPCCIWCELCCIGMKSDVALALPVLAYVWIRWYIRSTVGHIGFHCFEQRSRGEGSVSAADIQLRLLLVVVRVALPRRCARNRRVIAWTILLAEYRVHPAVLPSTACTLRYLPVEKPERLGSARLGCALRGCSLTAYGEWRRSSAVSAAQHRLRTLWTAPSPRGAL